MNQLPEFAVGMDLVRHGNLLWRKIQVWRGTVLTEGLAESTSVRGVGARHLRVRLLQKGALTWLQCSQQIPIWDLSPMPPGGYQTCL